MIWSPSLCILSGFGQWYWFGYCEDSLSGLADRCRKHRSQGRGDSIITQRMPPKQGPKGSACARISQHTTQQPRNPRPSPGRLGTPVLHNALFCGSHSTYLPHNLPCEATGFRWPQSHSTVCCLSLWMKPQQVSKSQQSRGLDTKFVSENLLTWKHACQGVPHPDFVCLWQDALSRNVIVPSHSLCLEFPMEGLLSHSSDLPGAILRPEGSAFRVGRYTS